MHPCECRDFSTPKVCVQNFHRVLEVERKLEDVDATASPHGGNVPTLQLFNQARLQLGDVTNLAAVHTILQLPQIW